jgi:hypothetical protein
VAPDISASENAVREFSGEFSAKPLWAKIWGRGASKYTFMVFRLTVTEP